MIGVHTVTLGAVDISCLVDEVTIHYGRDDTNSQPEANSATVEMSFDTSVDAYPPGLDAGANLTVKTGTAFRFNGRVTDITQNWQEAGAETPDRVELQVIATGPLADLGRRTVGDAPWAQEIDGSRVSRIMAAAGVTLNPATSDPGTVQILPRDVDSQPALDVAQSVAVSAGGIIWATRGGEIRYADADHRRGSVAEIALDACDILVTPKWSRTTDGLVNDVSIGYGVSATGGDQPRYTASRQDSIDFYGEYSVSTSTELAALADAQAMGNLLLTRNREPVWLMSILPVAVADLNTADTTALLALEMHSLISLTGLPAAGGAPTSAALWVEGWTERLAYGVHEFEMVVSGYCRTVPAPRWNDVSPTVTWDTIGATLNNWITNPAFRTGTTNWNPYSGTNATYTTLSNESTAGDYALKLTKNTAASNLGAVQAIGTPRPEGTVITMQCEARFPAGTPLNRQVTFIFREGPNNDSGCLTVTGGAITTTIPADGNFHAVY
jgi:hypothetical protein